MSERSDTERYAGSIMDERAGFEQHCKTTLRNSDCPYLRFGCLGCTPRRSMVKIGITNNREYGKRCESCWQYKPARMYYRPVRGKAGRHKDTLTFRRLCADCWAWAEEGCK
jgi:hypothetical protein